MSHSQLWAALLKAAADTRKLLALAAELLVDEQRAIFRSRLTRVLGDELGLANAERVARHGLPESPEEKDAIVATLDYVGTTKAILAPENDGMLEAQNVSVGGAIELAAYSQTLTDATRRVALVRRGLSAVGSGFLVGPDLLLTNAHVISEDGMPRSSDIDAIDVVMDFLGRGQAIVERADGIRVRELLRASPATARELKPGPLADWDAPDDHLDYALLRLARPVGNDAAPDTYTKTRHWYHLSPIEPDLSRSVQTMVIHFPRGKYLAWSPMKGSWEFNPSGTRTRMRYKSDTEPGSSGGPIIDEEGRLLAIHHRGQQPANQAVPIWLIAAAIEDLLVQETAPAILQPNVGEPRPKPSEALLVGNRPVVNRVPLRGKLWKAMTTPAAARSLVIVGTTDTGVSWSWWLLNHLAGESRVDDELRSKAPQGVKAVKIDLRKDIAKPVAARRQALIGALARSLGSEPPQDEWVAQAARQVSEFAEWCRRRLSPEGPQWWIFIDSIDEARDVKQHGVGEVLMALVDLADDQQVNLRLVLAGKKADTLKHESLSFAERDDTVGLTRQEVKTWLEEMAAKEGRVVDAGKLEAFLEDWFKTSATVSQPGQLTLALGAAIEEVSA
jgi:hypothetical protein